MEEWTKEVQSIGDFSRAFETIDSDMLLKKLHKYVIRDTELKWFKSYLMNRQ